VFKKRGRSNVLRFFGSFPPKSGSRHSGPRCCRCRATMEHLERCQGLSPESQDQNLVLTVLYVPSSLDSGSGLRGGGCAKLKKAGAEAGSYLRLIDSCITQLKAQGPSRTCNESKEEDDEGCSCMAKHVWHCWFLVCLPPSTLNPKS